MSTAAVAVAAVGAVDAAAVTAAPAASFASSWEDRRWYILRHVPPLLPLLPLPPAHERGGARRATDDNRRKDGSGGRREWTEQTGTVSSAVMRNRSGSEGCRGTEQPATAVQALHEPLNEAC